LNLGLEYAQVQTFVKCICVRSYVMATKRLEKGPRGGETTINASGMVRKGFWLNGDEAEALREKAYRERRAESEIVREALRLYLKIPD